MGLRISTNVSAISAQRNLSRSNESISKSYSQLSSGSRINKAADDAAGLSISDNMTAQIRSVRQASRNANDGIALIQVAEGGLSEISNIVIRLRELGMQAASDTVGQDERGFINKEVQQLKSEIQRITAVTKWGQSRLLDGTTPTYEFQIGTSNNEFEDRIAFAASENLATIDALGLSEVDYTQKEGAQTSLNALDGALTRVNEIRSGLGALQNRLTSTVTNLDVAEENMSAANSRIKDTDIAAVSADLAKNNILLQGGLSVMAQANQVPGYALKLLS
jgi:flagellin